MLHDAAQSLEEVLREDTTARALLPRLAAAAEAPGSPAFRGEYAGVPRRLGAAARHLVSPPAGLRDRARPHWTWTDYARAFLLLRGLDRLDRGSAPALVASLLEAGELGEQESLLRTLIVLAEPERFTDAAVAACRTNARRVFEAIACENPLPARAFPEPSFNQLVLKAIFLEIPVERIEGLRARVTPELVRMVTAYASERRAASRPVPADVDWITKAGTEP